MTGTPTPSSEPNLRRGVRRGLLRLFASSALLALVAVGWMVQARDTDGLLRVLAAARPTEIAVGCLLLVACLAWPAGWRWRSLLPVPADRGAPSGRFLSGVAAVQILAGLAVPGPAAELLAADLVRRGTGVPRAVALATSLQARLIGLLVALVHTVALLPFVAAAPGSRSATTVLAVATGLPFGLLVLLALTREPAVVAGPGGYADGAWPAGVDRGTARRPLAAAGRAYTAFRNAWTLDRPGPAHLRAAAWSSVSYGLGALGTLLVASGLRVGDPVGVLFAYNAVGAAVLVLFFLPGGSLTQDATLGALLVAAGGLAVDTALVVAAVVRLASTAGLAIAAAGLGRVDWTAGGGGGYPEAPWTSSESCAVSPTGDESS